MLLFTFSNMDVNRNLLFISSYLNMKLVGLDIDSN